MNLSGASEAAVRADRHARTADLSGGSRLDYYGSAKLSKTSVTGASQIPAHPGLRHAAGATVTVVFVRAAPNSCR